MGCDTMPAKSSSESFGIQEHEALQLVLENLSMIGLNSISFDKNSGDNQMVDLGHSVSISDVKRTSANITENIPVPSSEHVAEIVGKQGCKIKALRNKTNTYIKTPGRGDEPVFIITGRREDVDVAKAEILHASDHFSNIRAQRKGIAPPPIQPGQITKTIRVPYRVVGLVVGPKGQTIKQIQQKTQTYIVTPSRERDPVFEITGQPDSVEQARVEISNYIAARTGTFIDSEKKAIAPAIGSNSWASDVRNAESNGVPEEICEFLEDIFSSNSQMPSSAVSKRNSVDIGNSIAATQDSLESVPLSNALPDPFMVWNPSIYNDHNPLPDTRSGSPSPTHKEMMGNPSINADPGSGSGPSAYSSFSFELSPLVRSSSFPASGADGIPATGVLTKNTVASSSVLPSAPTSRKSASDPWSISSGSHIANNEFINQHTSAILPVSAASAAVLGGSHPGITAVAHPQVGPSAGTITASINLCVICQTNRVSAALVPCGHNLFCFDCVSSLVQSNNAVCPVCHQLAEHALRILQ